MITQDYTHLLTQVQPKPIHTEQEKKKMLEQVDRLMAIDENELTSEEGDLLELLAILIEDYESKTVKMPQKASPNDILIELMGNHDLKQKDLLDIFGSKGIISEVVNHKRTISKSQAKALGERFNVSPALFI
ncbi:helix-turn-helix domain-containing protein [Aphanothece sacrum]|uniref:Transcriptional regulator n=1 Tax=Aphanothece sacrum FPU1 TaxID=1920663 RepID=A0A401IEV1_APHSA|nr:transcriptional regulator [Aphanothece sacrum]GBF79817.1 transcriptional regulator [Aphanothece sacrum FPU1]GBF84829.1 transcriptional regulator [Aphanothece sacrum FPU3]